MRCQARCPPARSNGSLQPVRSLHLCLFPTVRRGFRRARWNGLRRPIGGFWWIRMFPIGMTGCWRVSMPPTMSQRLPAPAFNRRCITNSPLGFACGHQGRLHRNMKGRDYFGEVMEECRRHGLHRVAYYSLVFDDWAYQAHPDWRVVSPDYSELAKTRARRCCLHQFAIP